MKVLSLSLMFWLSTVAIIDITTTTRGTHAFCVPQRRAKSSLVLAPPSATSRSIQPEYEDEYEEFYDLPRPRELRTDSPEALELQQMRYPDDGDYDDLYNDYDNGQLQQKQQQRDFDGEYDQQDDPDYDIAGNFWSNPSSTVDSYPTKQDRRTLELQQQQQQQPQQRRTDDSTMPRSTAGPRRRRFSNPSARTTFRSGQPPAPDPIKNFYKRFFFYGLLDEDESFDEMDQRQNRNAFGGARGQFNALAYMKDGNRNQRPTRRIKRRLDEDEDEDDTYANGNERASRRDMYDEYGDNYRARRTRNDVSNWFSEEEEEEEEDYDYDYDNRRSRRPSQQGSQNIFTKFLDNVMDVDRDELDFQQQFYDDRMDRATRRPVNGSRRRREPIPYRYDQEDENDDDFGWEPDDIIDIDVVDTDTDEEQMQTVTPPAPPPPPTVAAEEEEEEPKRTESSSATKSPRISREERLRRLERVPPAGILAWGPAGDLGIDARTKAFLDGMDEIRECRTKIELKEKKVEEAKEEILILRGDTELQRKRADRSSDPRRTRERLRQLSFEIEEAARRLRRCQAEEKQAREYLERVQDKHWAVLSLYDVDKANQEVTRTLQGERSTNEANGGPNTSSLDGSSSDPKC